MSTAFKLVCQTFNVTVYDKGKPSSSPNFFKFRVLSEYILHVLSCALYFSAILFSLKFILDHVKRPVSFVERDRVSSVGNGIVGSLSHIFVMPEQRRVIQCYEGRYLTSQVIL